MGTEADVRAILTARAATAITAVSATLPSDHQNIDFQRPAAGKWAIPRWLSSARRQETLGPNGVDELRGAYQITLVYPTNTGTAAAVSDTQTIRGYFKIGEAISGTGQHVHITGLDSSDGRNVGTTYRETVTVYYQAQVAR